MLDVLKSKRFFSGVLGILVSIAVFVLHSQLHLTEDATGTIVTVVAAVAISLVFGYSLEDAMRMFRNGYNPKYDGDIFDNIWNGTIGDIEEDEEDEEEIPVVTPEPIPTPSLVALNINPNLNAGNWTDSEGHELPVYWEYYKDLKTIEGYYSPEAHTEDVTTSMDEGNFVLYTAFKAGIWGLKQYFTPPVAGCYFIKIIATNIIVDDNPQQNALNYMYKVIVDGNDIGSAVAFNGRQELLFPVRFNDTSPKHIVAAYQNGWATAKIGTVITIEKVEVMYDQTGGYCAS